MRLALIGFGGIARVIAETLRGDGNVELVAVAARPAHREAIVRTLGRVPVVNDARELIETKPEVVVECASHDAFLTYAEPLLGAGICLVALSVGVLADRGYRERVLESARTGGGILEIPAGAIGGIDAIAAARHAGLERVSYTTRKPPAMWRGTAAETMLDLAGVDSPRLFFDDYAERACALFKSKANVAATLALAGIGFEATRVRLWADPAVARSTHTIDMEGACGRMRVELSNTVAADGRASLLTAMSVVRAVRNRTGIVRL